MNKLKTAAAILGVFAGLSGASHGPGEILQGNVAPNRIMIMAWPQLKSSALAGEPAMTLMPNLALAGVLAIVLGALVVVWAGTCLERKQGGLLLIMLSLAMLLVGGGVVPPLFGIAAGTLGVILNYNTSKLGVGSI
jgi:hypothetical protein